MTGRIKTTDFGALFAAAPQDRTAAVVTNGATRALDHRLADLRLAVIRIDRQLRQANLDGTPRAPLIERKLALADEMTALRLELGMPSKAERKAVNRENATRFERAFVEEAKTRLPPYLFRELSMLATARIAKAADTAPEESA